MDVSNINMNGYYKDGYVLKKYHLFFEDEHIPQKVKDKFIAKIDKLNTDLEKYIKTPTW